MVYVYECSYTNGKTLVEITSDSHEAGYRVERYSIVGGLCSYPEKVLHYGTYKEARATFKRWVKRALQN